MEILNPVKSSMKMSYHTTVSREKIPLPTHTAGSVAFSGLSVTYLRFAITF